MAGIQVGGLASGLDTNSIIESLMEIKAQSLEVIEDKKARYQSNLSGISQLQSRVQTLYDLVEDMGDSDELITRQSTSSNSSAVSISAGSSASIGSYQMNIYQLATQHKVASQGFTDQDTTPIASGTGTFDFSVGSESFSIDVDDTTTLQDLADAINEETDSVSASIINDSSSSSPYRLVLTSSETGTDNEVKFGTNDTTLDFQNKRIEDAVASSENQFDGSVTSSGTYTGTDNKSLMVKITQAGALGSAKYKVSEDGGITWSDNEFTTSATASSVYQSEDEGAQIAFGAGSQDFAEGDSFSIDLFNPDIQEAKNAIFDVDGIAISQSSNTVEDVIEGLTLTLNETTESVVSLAVKDDTSSAKSKIEEFVSAYNSIISYIDTSTDYDSESGVASPLFGDSTTRTVTNTLRRALSPSLNLGDMDRLYELGITTARDGTLEIDYEELDEVLDEDMDSVVKFFSGDDENDGFATKFYDSLENLMDEDTGIFARREDTINGLIDSINDDIEDKETRMDKEEEILRKQFTSLETLMSTYSSQSSFLTNQLSSLS